MGPVGETVKQYILKEFLPGEDSDQLTETTPLITSGILDSLATLKLSTFLENEFDIQMEAHELDDEHIGSLAAIEQLINSKK
jgi:acyl carrier protein